MLQTRLWRIAFVSFAILQLAVLPIPAAEVPFLSGRVVDEANLLSVEAKQHLTEKLAALEQQTGAQVVVLTLASLGGDPIEDYSMRVVDTWKLGRAGVDDGVLILVARDDRQMRIEVGYGLEGAITDAQSGRIVDLVMAPHFREGDFGGGLEAAVDVIASAIRGEGLPLPEADGQPTGSDPGVLVFLFFFGFPFVSAAVSTRGIAGWILGLFLTLFFFGIPASFFGVKTGFVVAALWLVVFPLLRLVLPKSSAGRTGRSGGNIFWGSGSASSGGGFSGGSGGFSGGGGSFGGGGASGSW